MTSRQGLLELGLVDLAGAVGIDVDRQRLGDADGIGQLDRAAVGETRRHHVLGEVARRISGRAVDLGRVLAGERAAAMRRRAAVRVDDDLAAREPAIAVGAADEELARRVDVPDRVLADPALGQRLAHIGLDDLADLGRGQVLVDVLVRDDDLRDADRLAVLVAHRHLALGVGTEQRRGALLGVPRLRQIVQDLVRVVDRRRHRARASRVQA